MPTLKKTSVSRILDNTNRNFTGVIFQQKRPPLDSEWNLVQSISQENISQILKKTTPSGFLDIGKITTAPRDRDQLTSSWANTLLIQNKTAIVNGWIIHVGGGNNQFQPNAQVDIWHELSNNENELAIIGEEAPYIGYREDLLFLEVWQKVIETSDTIQKYGNVQSSVAPYANDLIDPDIEIETSKRVQIQYRTRWVTGIDFSSYRDGIDFPGVYASDVTGNPNANYTFKKHPEDPGLYIAGDGSDNSKNDLGTFDGYVYAIPIARIHRRNRERYSLINQNGASKSLTTEDKSERPDGLFYDEIAPRDIEDLRHQVYTGSIDYKKLLEENIAAVWDDSIPRELKYSEIDENLAGNILIQVDGISNEEKTGVNQKGRDPDGVLRTFTEALQEQTFIFYSSSPSFSPSGQMWFTPVGHQEETYEYELYDEEKVYISDEEPLVQVIDINTKEVTTIYGGEWEGLGEFRTWDYLSGNRNKIIYTPIDTGAIQNKEIVITFKLKIREGAGLANNSGGFTFPIKEMLTGKNDFTGYPVDFNLYSDSERKVPLGSEAYPLRKLGDLEDTAIGRSVSSFEKACKTGNPASGIYNDDQVYKGACVECKYYKIYSGDTTDVIDKKVYDRDVLGILSVYNVTQSRYMYGNHGQVPSIEKYTTGTTGFKLTGLEGNSGDILEYTLLLGNYTVDYTPHIKGVTNFASTYTFTNPITVGDTHGLINVKAKSGAQGLPAQSYNHFEGSCDAVLAVAGFFNGIEYKPIAYINNKLVLLDRIENLGTPLVKYYLEEESPYTGTIDIPFIGYYNPRKEDDIYFEYKYSPYAGIISTRLHSEDEQKLKILSMDNQIAVITAGTGLAKQDVPEHLKGLATRLPINASVLEYNLHSDNIPSPLSGGITNFRRIIGRGLSPYKDSEFLKEGSIITLRLGEEDENTVMKRGVIVSNPKLSERGIDFQVPFNHMTQWTALVEGSGVFKGELMLLVITTVCTKYNQDEGSEYEYLEQKNIYRAEAVNKGSLTVLNNGLTGLDMSQNLGETIYGAADIYPLKNRPLVVPSSDIE